MISSKIEVNKTNADSDSLCALGYEAALNIIFTSVYQVIRNYVR